MKEITKKFGQEDTLAIKGMAIIFMYWHHCFLSRDRFEGCSVNFMPLPDDLAIYIAAFLKICVGMFVFLSAYGITRSTKQRYGSIVLSRKNMYKNVFSRWYSLMQGWLFVFFICELVTFLVDKRPLQIYGTGKKAIVFAILDMLGLAHLFDTPLLLATWWYMSLAIIIILLMPLLLGLYEKIGFLMIPLSIILPKALALQTTDLIRWLLAIVLGIWFAEENIFEKAKTYLLANAKILKFLVATMILGMLIIFRQSEFAKQWLYVSDGIIPAYMILYLYSYITDIPVVRNVLIILGKHSMNMFLTHNFIRVTYLYEWTYSFKNAFLIVVVLLTETLVLSIFIEKIKEMIHYNKLCKRVKKIVLKE